MAYTDSIFCNISDKIKVSTSSADDEIAFLKNAIYEIQLSDLPNELNTEVVKLTSQITKDFAYTESIYSDTMSKLKIFAAFPHTSAKYFEIMDFSMLALKTLSNLTNDILLDIQDKINSFTPHQTYSDVLFDATVKKLKKFIKNPSNDIEDKERCEIFFHAMTLIETPELTDTVLFDIQKKIDNFSSSEFATNLTLLNSLIQNIDNDSHMYLQSSLLNQLLLIVKSYSSHVENTSFTSKNVEIMIHEILAIRYKAMQEPPN